MNRHTLDEPRAERDDRKAMSRAVEKTWSPVVGTVPLELLHPETQLVLSSGVQLVEKDGRLAKIDLGGRMLSLDEESSERVSRMLRFLDGKRTLELVADACEWPLDETLEAAQQLYLNAVVRSVGDALVPALTFAVHLDNYVKCVQVRMASDVPSLLAALEEKPSRRLLVGALIENYHYVISAATHISPAISRAPNVNLQMMLSEYLSGEYWHGLWLRQGLVAAGVKEEDLERSDPLPGTLAIVNCMRWASSTDLLAYSACLAAGELEGGEKSTARTKRYFDALLRMGLVTEPVIAPFRDHALEDCSGDHHSYASEAFAISPPLTRAQQDSIRRTVLSYQRSVGEQQRQILRFYGENEGAPFFTAD